ncbi:c-type cytochrome [Mucilaginibacter pedocola]|uniref:Photosynthetic reaction center cytochrome c subunit n=1 Tax=Mucilaginibacter pedocola TaxID=1792845 RepID=A0A1S9PIX7_9SPHI|nr:c-type cytochrome [Mucilaginibacter pedocola]OOQ60887.1 hypothetical protein BC343_23275 [Mucilaginibacter pedocola]
MTINKKLTAVAALLSVVAFMAMSPAPPAEEHKFENLKVLPKKITGEQLHDVMEGWNMALGVRCNFCHARNESTNKMDFASDAKPEKQMARDMFKMTAALNKKYFGAKKDSLGMVMQTGVNCNTCHRGTSHPEIVKPPKHGPGPGGPGVPPPPGGPAGTPPPPPPPAQN